MQTYSELMNDKKFRQKFNRYVRQGKKFILLPSDEKIGYSRIMACKDFGDVKKGDIGGFVLYINNLSQEGDCWIYDDAIVVGKKSRWRTTRRCAETRRCRTRTFLGMPT